MKFQNLIDENGWMIYIYCFILGTQRTWDVLSTLAQGYLVELLLSSTSASLFVIVALCSPVTLKVTIMKLVKCHNI